MPTKRVYISLPEELLKDLDSAARQDFTSRSSYIRESVQMRLAVEGFTETNSIDPRVQLIQRAYTRIKIYRRINKMIKNQ